MNTKAVCVLPPASMVSALRHSPVVFMMMFVTFGKGPFSNMQHTQHTESHVEFRCSKCSSSHILNHTGNPVCFPRYFFHTMPSHSVWIAVGRRPAILHVAAAALLSLAGNADGSTTVGNSIPGVEHVERTSLNQHFLNN